MVEVHTISEPGGHAINEDAYFFNAHPTDAGCWLCCVADGQGGRAGGARAAQLACQSVIEVACRTPVGMLVGARAWGFLLQGADQSIAADSEAGFTTLIGFCIRLGRIVGASSGDSAVLLLNRERDAILTDGQAKNPPVGSGSAVLTEFTAELGDGWRVLAMTDGVWKYVGWNRVISTTRNLSGRAVLEELRELARLPRTSELQDDFTAILVSPEALPPSSPNDLSQNETL